MDPLGDLSYNGNGWNFPSEGVIESVLVQREPEVCLPSVSVIFRDYDAL